MTAYIEIPDADIEPDQPIKSSTAFALRDNLLAVIEGDATAPKITARTISPGGSRADGDCTDATSFPGPGFFDFSTLVLTAAKTLPFASFIRVDGDATISSVLTARRTFASAAAEAGTLAGIGGASPQPSDGLLAANAATGGGGGVVGAGGNASGAIGSTAGASGLVPSVADVVRLWAARRALVGGNSGSSSASGVAGGGFVGIVVNGNLDLTGGTIDASGADGAVVSNNASGGGGGGAIVIVCTGTITGGTYDVSGGDGGSSGGDGGGGGGGLVLLVATSFAGTRTKVVAGGAGGVSTGFAGSAGLAVESTLTAGQINALLLGAQ